MSNLLKLTSIVEMLVNQGALKAPANSSQSDLFRNAQEMIAEIKEDESQINVSEEE